MNAKLRELFSNAVSSTYEDPDVFELETYLENYEIEFDLVRRQLADAEALLAELERDPVNAPTFSLARSLDYLKELIFHPLYAEAKRFQLQTMATIHFRKEKAARVVAKRAGKPVSASEAVDSYVELAPKILPVLLHNLSGNGYFKLTPDLVNQFQESGRTVAVKEKADGLHLFLLDPEEKAAILAKGNAQEIQQ